MVISNHSRHPSHNIWLYINRCHLSLEFPHSGRTVKKGKDSSPTYRSNCTLNEVSLKPNVWLNLYKCAIHLNTWKPELASVHRQHVEARLNYAHRIPSSSTGKGTQRRQVANCFGESMHMHIHTHTLTVVLIRQHVRAGEIKCSSFRKHSLSTVCVRVGGGDGAVKGLCVLVEPCMVVSAHHMFSSHNTYKPVKRTPPKSRCY